MSDSLRARTVATSVGHLSLVFWSAFIQFRGCMHGEEFIVLIQWKAEWYELSPVLPLAPFSRTIIFSKSGSRRSNVWSAELYGANFLPLKWYPAVKLSPNVSIQLLLCLLWVWPMFLLRLQFYSMADCAPTLVLCLVRGEDKDESPNIAAATSNAARSPPGWESTSTRNCLNRRVMCGAERLCCVPGVGRLTTAVLQNGRSRPVIGHHGIIPHGGFL